MQQKIDLITLDFYPLWDPHYNSAIRHLNDYYSKGALGREAYKELAASLVDLNQKILKSQIFNRKDFNSIIQSISDTLLLFQAELLHYCIADLQVALKSAEETCAKHFSPSIQALPNDIHQQFYGLSSTKDLLSFSQTCKFFYNSLSPLMSSRVGKTNYQIAAGSRHTVICKDNKLFCFGDNSHGQLGSSDEKANQNVIILPEGLLPHHILARKDCTHILTVCGRVFAFGMQNETKMLLQEIKIPQRVRKRVRNFALGDNHGLYLTTDSKLYRIGDNGNCQLGKGPTIIKSLEEITPVSGKINKIFAFCDVTFLVFDDNSVFGMGVNDYCELSFSWAAKRGEAKQVELPKDKEVLKIDGTSDYIVFLFKDGSISAFGSGAEHLGIKPSQKFSLTTVSLPGEAIDISCGKSHTFILLRDGTLLAAGRNLVGLGLGQKDDTETYIKVELVESQKAGMFCCGESHNVIQTSQGKVLIGGNNASGQVGRKDKDLITSFIEPNLDEPKKSCCVM